MGPRLVRWVGVIVCRVWCGVVWCGVMIERVGSLSRGISRGHEKVDLVNARTEL